MKMKILSVAYSGAIDDFRVDAELAKASRDEESILRTIVEDQKAFVDRTLQMQTWVSSIKFIVRCFSRDVDIMHMAFAQSRRGDLDEFCPLIEIFDRGGLRRNPSPSEAAHELEHVVGKRSAIRDAAFDAFRHEFARIFDVAWK